MVFLQQIKYAGFVADYRRITAGFVADYRRITAGFAR
jgi:hypothetical protein